MLTHSGAFAVNNLPRRGPLVAPARVTCQAAQLAKRGKLRRGITVQRATDVLLTIVSAETYQQLTAGRGWSRAEVRKWLLEVLTQQLLPPR
jgi:hypothetical protein